MAVITSIQIMETKQTHFNTSPQFMEMKREFQFPTVKVTFSTIFHGHEMPGFCYLKQNECHHI